MNKTNPGSGRDGTDLERVALGRITKPQGLRGQLRVKLYNPDSDLLWQHDTWQIEQGESKRSVEVSRVRMASHDVAVVAFDGVTSRDAADSLRGWEVMLPISALPEAGEGEWYVRDLIGLEVVDAHNETIGRVIDTIAYPSVDCLLIETEAGRFEIPMVEPYLGCVDLAEGRVVVQGLEDFENVS